MSKTPKMKKRSIHPKEYNISLYECEGTLDKLIGMLHYLRDACEFGGDAKISVETDYGYYDDPDIHYLKIKEN